MSDLLEATRRPVRKTRLVLFLTALLIVVALLCWAAVTVLQHWSNSAPDFGGPGSGEAVIEVSAGDTSADIGATLSHAGVVASTAAFVDAAVADDRSLGIQPGFYQLRLKMSAAGALELMLDPSSRVETQVTIPEGLRLDQTVDRLVDETDISRGDYEAVLKNPSSLGLPSYAEGNPEGFLFPATYTFNPDVTAKEVLKAMVDRFDVAAKELHLVQRAADAGSSPRDVVTIGSLVQAEVSEDDFGKASRVVANRLAAGMPLQFDSTVNYALESDDLTLTNEQLGTDSPYNTYQNTGLPPGPINSPGEAALEAALDPPAGDWLYFVALAPGSDQTRFTADYNQFLQFKDEFYAQVP
ncbi:MAG TPA: endolytic transglycosylase MltG [Actinomycetes bacterium]|nr:endolytic transglycosylase MltG [Actinomycetes bacterium]